MSIYVQVVDERGEVRAEGAGAPGRLDALLPDFDARDFPLLRFVDPYGDTVFNGLQCRAVLDELTRLEAATTADDDQQVLSTLSELTAMVAQGVHLYLRFVGD